jgi:UDP-3-O-[3-hydroxymyristoyl] glucosamine N-acyltransferase
VADSRRAGSEAPTLDELAALVGGEVVGDGGIRVSRVAPLDQAGEDELAFFADGRYAQALERTRGGAVLVSAALAGQVRGKPSVVVGDAHLALRTILERLHPPAKARPGVHPTAVLGKGVRLGRDVQIDPYAVLDDDCEVGDRVRVGSHSVVGSRARVGDDSVLHAHVVLYPDVVVGRRVILHAGVRLGADGFGYAFANGLFNKIPQVGRCIIEDDVEMGANTCVDRGSIGDTVVGRGTKLDNLVQVGHNVRIGQSCALAGQVGVAGSTRIGNGVVFGGQSGATGHLTIGDGVQVAAQAEVTNDLAPGERVAGTPARDLRGFLKSSALFLKLPEIIKRIRTLERKVGIAGPAEG